jgi:hypothetical protein
MLTDLVRLRFDVPRGNERTRIELGTMTEGPVKPHSQLTGDLQVLKRVVLVPLRLVSGLVPNLPKGMEHRHHSLI